MYQINRQTQILPLNRINEYSDYDIVLCKSTQYNKLMETFEFSDTVVNNDEYTKFFEDNSIYKFIENITKKQDEISKLSQYDLCKTRISLV